MGVLDPSLHYYSPYSPYLTCNQYLAYGKHLMFFLIEGVKMEEILIQILFIYK